MQLMHSMHISSGTLPVGNIAKQMHRDGSERIRKRGLRRVQLEYSNGNNFATLEHVQFVMSQRDRVRRKKIVNVKCGSCEHEPGLRPFPCPCPCPWPLINAACLARWPWLFWQLAASTCNCRENRHYQPKTQLQNPEATIPARASLTQNPA